jgi:hypothetical protein
MDEIENRADVLPFVGMSCVILGSDEVRRVVHQVLGCVVLVNRGEGVSYRRFLQRYTLFLLNKVVIFPFRVITMSPVLLML